MADRAQTFASLDEFLAWERQQEERYEYIDGVVTMMAGGSMRHTLVAENIKRALYNRLRGTGCTVLGSDAKVVLAGRLIYPDVSVTCTRIVDMSKDIVPEPVVLIEVISPSTAHRDKVKKRLRAFQTASVRHFVLIEQDEVLVDVFTRADGTWTNAIEDRLDSAIELSALRISIPLAEIYEGTDLPSEAA